MTQRTQSLAALPALATLFLAAPLVAETPAWRAALERAVEADDYADYKKAELLFSEVCDEAQGFASTEYQVEACVGLAHVYTVDGKFGKAKKTLLALLERLEQAQAPHAYSYAQALLELANVEMALARFDDGVKHLRQIGEPMKGLTAPQTALILAGLAEFYLPIDKQAVGGDMLRGAVRAVQDGWDPNHPQYLEAAVRVARVARWYDRHWQSTKLLELVVEAGRARFAGAPEDKLPVIYSSAALELSSLLSGRGGDEEQAQQLREQARRWRSARASRPSGRSRNANVDLVGSEVSAPRLLKKQEPSYTEGALLARAAGRVSLAVEVWPDGRAHNVRIVQPLPYGLSWQAIRSVRKWRFDPARRDGQPVKVAATVEVTFRLL